jgi:hypothetical protein
MRTSGRSDEFADPFFAGAVRVTAGEVGEDAAGLGEADVGALAAGEVAEGLGDVGLADADRAEEDDRLARVKRGAPRSRIWAAGGFEEAVKSNSSRVTCCSTRTGPCVNPSEGITPWRTR